MELPSDYHMMRTLRLDWGLLLNLGMTTSIRCLTGGLSLKIKTLRHIHSVADPNEHGLSSCALSTPKLRSDHIEMFSELTSVECYLDVILRSLKCNFNLGFIIIEDRTSNHWVEPLQVIILVDCINDVIINHISHIMIVQIVHSTTARKSPGVVVARS